MINYIKSNSVCEMSRSRKYKKAFACGHQGFGQWCHACVVQQRVKQSARKSRDRHPQQQQQWQAAFQPDQIDLTHLPKHIVPIARHKISFLMAGGSYRQLGGKRIRCNRSLLSIPVTRNYRLLCHITSHQITPQQVLSHEAYNSIVRNTRR